MENKKPQIKIQVPETIFDGRYSNFAVINHKKGEFTFDFVYIPPGQPMGRTVARIILTPENSKRVLMAINNNVTRYEEKYGVIEIDDINDSPSQIH